MPQQPLTTVRVFDDDKPRCRCDVEVYERNGALILALEDGAEIACLGYCEMDGLFVMTWNPTDGQVTSHTKLGHV